MTSPEAKTNITVQEMVGTAVVSEDDPKYFIVDDVLDRCGTWGAHHWLLLLYSAVSAASFAGHQLSITFLEPSVKCVWPHVSSIEAAALVSSFYVGARPLHADDR